jgi:hypothetical protein
MVVQGFRAGCALLFLCAASGCSGKSVEHVDPDAILGDWLLCKDSSCTAIDTTGIRVRPEGVQVLQVTAGPVSPPVCVRAKTQMGPYEFDGSLFTFSGNTIEVSINGDHLRLIDAPVGTDFNNAKLMDLDFLRTNTYEGTNCP